MDETLDICKGHQGTVLMDMLNKSTITLFLIDYDTLVYLDTRHTGKSSETCGRQKLYYLTFRFVQTICVCTFAYLNVIKIS
jgi:hypothetical protein